MQVSLSNRWWMNGALLFTAVLLLNGFLAPLFSFKQFFIFNHQVSLLSALQELLAEGFPLLFLVIFLFSVCLPVTKLLLLWLVFNRNFPDAARFKRVVHVMDLVGKWSMLDVFVVAVILVSIKLKPVASVQVHIGLYCFATAILLMMYITHRLRQLLKQASANSNEPPVL